MTPVINSKSKIISEIEKNKIFTVVRANNAQQAIDISKALIEGGLKIIEIAASFDDLHVAVEEIAKIKDVSVAAGSIITTEQAERAIGAGAKLIVSPVLEMSVLKQCKGHKITHITTASTATEAYNAWKLGVNIIKMFPAQVLGGPEYLKDILKPMPFLPLMPTGGVTSSDFIKYLETGAVAVGMGKCFYENETSYTNITRSAANVVDKLNTYLQSNQ